MHAVREFTERQLEIIRATIGLVSEEGLQNFSIRKLAKRVGVTEPAIYRHFENKDDLMIKLASHIVRNWHGLLDELPIPKLPFIEQVRYIFDQVVFYFEENRAFAKTLVSATFFDGDSGMSEILMELKNEGLMRFAEFLTIGQKAGAIRSDIEPVDVARVFFGSVWWLVVDWVSRQFPDNLKKEWVSLWSCLAALLEPRPA